MELKAFVTGANNALYFFILLGPPILKCLFLLSRAADYRSAESLCRYECLSNSKSLLDRDEFSFRHKMFFPSQFLRQSPTFTMQPSNMDDLVPCTQDRDKPLRGHPCQWVR